MPRRGSRFQLERDYIRWYARIDDVHYLENLSGLCDGYSTEYLRQLAGGIEPQRRGRPRKLVRSLRRETADFVESVRQQRRRNPKRSISAASSDAGRQHFKGDSETALRKRYYDACKKLGLDPQAT